MVLNHNTNICIKSQINDRFLRYQASMTSPAYGLLEFSAGDLFDPYVQIEVVKTDDSNLVHLKSRYNNKYLVRQAPDSRWISASADAPKEDKTSWDCTFFNPILIRQDVGSWKLQIQHVQLGNYLTLGTTPFANCLYADPTKRDVFDVINWDSVIRFRQPRKVAFKGSNNQYLGVYMNNNGKPNLQFSFNDPKDPKAAHEIIPTANDAGLLTVKSTYLGKYWRLDKNDHSKIVVDVKNPNTTNNPLPFFRFSTIDINCIALLSAGNAKYCKRHNDATVQSPELLVANVAKVDIHGQLVMVDLED